MLAHTVLWLIAGEHESTIFTELSSILTDEIAGALREATPGDADVYPLAESIYFAYIGRLFTWQPSNDSDVAELKRSLRRIIDAICRTKELEK